MSDNTNWLGQEEPKPASKPAVSTGNAQERSELVGGWSWGGSFLTMLTLAVGRQWGLFILLIISFFIPLINILAYFGWLIYGGLNGNTIIYESSRFSTDEERKGAIIAMNAAGFVMFIFFLITVIFYLAAGAMIMSMISSLSGGMSW